MQIDPDILLLLHAKSSFAPGFWFRTPECYPARTPKRGGLSRATPIRPANALPPVTQLAPTHHRLAQQKRGERFFMTSAMAFYERH